MMILHKGRVRRLAEPPVEDLGQVSVKIIMPGRTKRVVAGSLPGPGWRQESREKKTWVKHIPEIVSAVLPKTALLASWPVGLGMIVGAVEAFAAVIRPFIERSIKAGGEIRMRVKPRLQYETVESAAKAEGLPVPTPEEMDEVVTRVWQEVTQELRPSRRKPVQQIAKSAAPPAELQPEPEPPAPVAAAEEEDPLVTASLKNGWPKEAMKGAAEARKGAYGRTLKYMSKNKFDPEEHAPKARK